MVNGPTSVRLAAALLAVVEKVVLPRDLGHWVLRDERDCLVCKSALLFSLFREQSRGDESIEEQPSTDVRLRSA